MARRLQIGRRSLETPSRTQAKFYLMNAEPSPKHFESFRRYNYKGDSLKMWNYKGKGVGPGTSGSKTNAVAYLGMKKWEHRAARKQNLKKAAKIGGVAAGVGGASYGIYRAHKYFKQSHQNEKSNFYERTVRGKKQRVKKGKRRK